MAGLTAAHQLGAHLAAGGQPTPVTASIPLLDGEQVYSVQPFILHEYSEGTASYNQTWVGIGSPFMMAATLAGSALVNNGRRQQAMAYAAAQWIYLPAIRNTEVVPGEGIVVFLDGVSPWALRVRWPEYHFVLLQFLAYGRVIPLPCPADLPPGPSGALPPGS